jgi:hypothetical protein
MVMGATGDAASRGALDAGAAWFVPEEARSHCLR